MAQSHQRQFSRRQLAVIAKIAFIEAMALSLIIPTISSTGEITINPTSSTGPINFLSTLFKNSTSSDTNQFLITPIWTTSQNETMIIVASSQNTFDRGIVISVTDTLKDSFSLIIREHVPGISEPNDLEVWIGKDSPFKQNSVTVTWNITNNANGNMVQTLLYQNIASVGQSTGQAQECPCTSPTLTLTTLKSGDLILGSTSTQSIPGTPATTPCPGQITLDSIGFITRNKGCSTPTGTDGTETWASDNSTSLRNGVTLTYQPTFNAGSLPVNWSQVEIEFIPIDLEPQEQNIITSNFCQTTGSTCHVNFATKTSGINTAQSVFAGTTYCTGITTTALTTTAIHSIQLWANYAGADLNTTGTINPTITIFLKIGTTAPSTSFGSGVCASGGIVEGTGTLQFGIVGPLTPTTTFSLGINGWCTTTSGPCNVAGTFYGWLEIVPHNFSGHMSFDQVNNVQADGVSSISMMEIN